MIRLGSTSGLQSKFQSLNWAQIDPEKEISTKEES